jgi:hypothetical protein
MHTSASAVTPVSASSTIVVFHPVAIAIRGIAVFPYIHKIVIIDISLVIVGTNTGTGINYTPKPERTKTILYSWSLALGITLDYFV